MMIKSAFIAAQILSLTVTEAAEYYVASNGNDANPGTISHPFGTLQRAHNLTQPGDTVWIRGGSYVFDNPATQGMRYLAGTEPDPGEGINNVGVLFSTSGTASQPITYQGYPGETPVFDFSAYQPAARIRGFSVQASYLIFREIEVKGVQQIVTTVNESWGVRLEGTTNPSNNVFERLDLHHNEGPGLFIASGASNLVLNCDSHHNWDPDRGGENGDGFGSHSSLSGNHFLGNRAWENSDDGYDCINSPGQVIFENNWAWRNGWIPGTTTVAGNGGGFKCGGFVGHPVPNPIPRHQIIGNVAWGNRVWGINANNHQGPSDFINNTAFGNPRGFDFNVRANVAHYARNNVSYGNTSDVYQMLEVVDDEFNTWNPGFAATATDFVSTSPAGMDGPRGTNGALPVVDFMRLAQGGNLLDVGQVLDRHYFGIGPDLGAFEYRGIPVPGIRVVNVATSNTATGSASSITIPGFSLGAGNALVVVINTEGSTNYSATYQVASQPVRPLTNNAGTAQGAQGAAVFWLIDPAISATTGDVVVNFGGNSSAAVSVLSLANVHEAGSTAIEAGTTTASLTLNYAAADRDLVVAGGIDNTFSGETPGLAGAFINTALQALPSDFSGGSAGIMQGYGRVDVGGGRQNLAETFNPAGTGASSRNAAVLVAFTRNDANTYNDWAYPINWGSSDSSPAADPNLDGVVNLLAYYLDLDPLATVLPGQLPVSGIDTTTADGPWLVFDYRENTKAGDLTAIVQTSATLQSNDWPPVVPDGVNAISEVADVDPDGDGSAVSKRVRIKISEERRFLRLHLTSHETN